MSRAARVAGACVAAALVLAACGEREKGPKVDVGPSGATWAQMAKTLPDSAGRDSPNPCGRGVDRCIEIVAGEMQRRLDLLAAGCDHNAPFLLMYMRVTERVGASGDPRARGKVPDDEAYLNHLDAVFARLYFAAFDAWRSEGRAEVPQAWRIAFDAADRREVAGIGDMLLGMNAHISRDLPYALEEAGLETPDGADAERAYDSVNALLGKVQGSMVAEQTRRFDPGTASATVPGLGLNAETMADVLGRWRSEAFDNGRRLIEARDGRARAVVADQIERDAAGRARLIRTLTSNLVIGPGRGAREDHCRRAR